MQLLLQLLLVSPNGFTLNLPHKNAEQQLPLPHMRYAMRRCTQLCQLLLADTYVNSYTPGRRQREYKQRPQSCVPPILRRFAGGGCYSQFVDTTRSL